VANAHWEIHSVVELAPIKDYLPLSLEIS
jgi:hypothetical protein